jgi:hypothetical protein
VFTSADLSGNPTTSGSLFAYDIDVESTGNLATLNQEVFDVSGPDVQVYDSVFHANPSAPPVSPEYNFSQNFGDGSIISGNTFIDTNSASAIENSQNVIVENNSAYSEDGPGDNGGMAFTIARSFQYAGPSLVSRDVYVGYNKFHDMGWPGQQVIQTDGGGGAYYGYVSDSTPDTVTLADDPTWFWTGTSNLSATSISIISGTGIGQTSLMASIDGRTLGVVTPWAVPPDSSSIVEIGEPLLNLTISHNTFADSAGGAINMFGGGLGLDIEDNFITDTGDGILILAYGPYGGPAAYNSTFDTDVLRNTITKGSGDWITESTNNNIAGIGIADMPGCDMSGLLIRDNVIPDDQTIYETNGVNGISANLIEQNTANLIYLSYPGFLVQDNQSPPSP